MDSIQRKIVETINKSRSCLGDRNALKQTLMNNAGIDKRHINLVLYSFDEGNISKKGPYLNDFNADELAKKLVDEYGISVSDSSWSVATWELVFAEGNVSERENQLARYDTADCQRIKELTVGMYKAGVDFPIGVSKVTARRNDDDSLPYIHYGIGNNPNNIETEMTFEGQVYVELKKGEYINFWSYAASNTRLIVEVIE